MPEDPIACAGALIFRASATEGSEILLQLRVIQNPEYDTMYDRTWETPAGTMETKDWGPVHTVLREAQEECGLSKGDIFDSLVTSERMSARNGEMIYFTDPFHCSYQYQGPHPWLTVFFVFEARANWQPKSGDGEAGEFRWVTPRQLVHEIEADPTRFFGPHRTALRKLAKALIEGHIAPRSPMA